MPNKNLSLRDQTTEHGAIEGLTQIQQVKKLLQKKGEA